jgi:tetratricopeptide (TPR) repeat protein
MIMPTEQSTLLKTARSIIATEGNGDERAARLAYLFQAAEELHEAVRYWIQAGCFEKELHHNDRAYEYFKNAQDLIRKLGDSADIGKLLVLIKAWGDLALDENDLPTFISLCEDSQQYGESRGDQRLIGLAKSGYGWSSHIQGNSEVAEGFLLQAIEIFQEINDPIDLMDAYTRLGIHYLVNQDFLKAKTIFDKMPKMAILHQNSELMANYKKYAAYIVYVYCTVGKLNIARAIINEAKSLLVSSKEIGTVIRTRIAETIVEYYFGNFDAVRQNTKEILPQMYSKNQGWWEYSLQIIDAQAALENGNLNDCWKISDAICMLNTPIADSEWGTRYSNYLRGEIFLHLGDFQKARAYYARNQEFINDPFISMLTQFGLARLTMKREKSRDRGNMMREVQRNASVRGFENIVQMASIELLYLELEGMESNSLSKEFLRETELLKTSEYPQIRTANLELLGRGYLKTGNEEKGKEYLQRALRAANEGHFFWNQISILAGLAQNGRRNSSQDKELRRLIEKEQITCEIPELASALERFKNSWKV